MKKLLMNVALLGLFAVGTGFAADDMSNGDMESGVRGQRQAGRQRGWFPCWNRCCKPKRCCRKPRVRCCPAPRRCEPRPVKCCPQPAPRPCPQPKPCCPRPAKRCCPRVRRCCGNNNGNGNGYVANQPAPMMEEEVSETIVP